MFRSFNFSGGQQLLSIVFDKIISLHHSYCKARCISTHLHINEPEHSIPYKSICAPSEDSDQPTHPHSLSVRSALCG